MFITNLPASFFDGPNIRLLLLLFLVQARNCLGQSDVASNGQNIVDTKSQVLINTVEASPIDVSIDIKPYVSRIGTIYVAANTQLNISAIVPESKYNVSNLVFKWSTKDGEIKTQPHAKDITYTFSKSDVDNYISVTVEDPERNATGSAKRDVTVRSPVVVLDPIGKLFLERGELIDIRLKYNGSPPFKYCYKFCTPYDILPCNFCFPSYQTTSTVIPIVHYLHNVGSYTLMFQIENVMNQDEKHYTIKINDTVRKTNLPIAPIVSTIMAVFILISGVALHLKFRDASYTTETANFDFFNDNDDEDWEQEFSFIQRVKYLFCGISDQDDEDETRYLLRKSSPASSSNGLTTTTTIITDNRTT